MKFQRQIFKSLSVVALVVSTVNTAWGQSSLRPGDSRLVPAPGNNDRVLIERVRGLSQRINARLQRDADLLPTRDLLDTLESLRSIAMILRENDVPPPDLPPGPPHRPPPGRGDAASVRGTIENVSFSFDGRSLEDIYDQCESLYNSRLNGVSVDDISVSVNFGPTVNLRNSASYWRSSGSVCGQIINVTNNQTQLPVGEHNRFILSGTIENVAFKFKGRDLVDVNRQCETLHQTRLQGVSVDDIVVSVNFGEPIVKRNSASYWRTSFEVCDQILKTLNGR